MKRTIKKFLIWIFLIIWWFTVAPLAYLFDRDDWNKLYYHFGNKLFDE
jgi:hypothetical protein